MPTTKTSTRSSFKLINPKSFFDVFVTCPSAFDRETITQIEAGSKSCEMQIENSSRNLVKILLPLAKIKMTEDHLPLLRTTLFYYILQMDYLLEDMQGMMMAQAIALDINGLYCEVLDKTFKTNPQLVQSELDKVLTFQSSDDCATPNILKENFLEMSKTKAIGDFAKEKFKNVDFEKPNEDEIVEIDEELKAMAEAFCQKAALEMEQISESEALEIIETKINSNPKKSKKTIK